MKTDIEIAQSAEMQPITAIAEAAGIPVDCLEPYGKYKAKINLGDIPADFDKKVSLYLLQLSHPHLQAKVRQLQQSALLTV